MKWLYLIGALVVLQIGAWAFAPAPQPKKLPDSTRAYGPNEDIAVEGRNKQRLDAIAALELPTGSRCTPDGHKRFISGLGHYYFHRQTQLERYPETYGKLGADYIARQWASSDDKRIDRLTQEAYGKGFLIPDEFQALPRRMILTVVMNERVTAKGCG